MSPFTPILEGCAASILLLITAAQASTPLPTQSAKTQLAADAAYCQSWHDQINAAIAAYNSSCSGAVDPVTHDRCAARKSQIDNDVARYNSQCGG